MRTEDKKTTEKGKKEEVARCTDGKEVDGVAGSVGEGPETPRPSRHLPHSNTSLHIINLYIHIYI